MLFTKQASGLLLNIFCLFLYSICTCSYEWVNALTCVGMLALVCMHVEARDGGQSWVSSSIIFS